MKQIPLTPGEQAYEDSRLTIVDLYGDHRANDDDHGGEQISQKTADAVYARPDDPGTNTGQMDLFSMLDTPAVEATTSEGKELDIVHERLGSAALNGDVDPRSSKYATELLNRAAKRGKLGPRTTGRPRYRV